MALVAALFGTMVSKQSRALAAWAVDPNSKAVMLPRASLCRQPRLAHTSTGGTKQICRAQVALRATSAEEFDESWVERSGSEVIVKVCSRCLQRKMGGGFDSVVALRSELAQIMDDNEDAYWLEAVSVDVCPCMGSCKSGPNVQIYAEDPTLGPVVAGGMTPREKGTRLLTQVHDDETVARVCCLAVQIAKEGPDPR
eukprot:CAMPEP_0115079710 /NCGR_PEP_ID=MMETSP0227-20121206/18263_1 /TAXON_ID=89957 /ORGANISM="Polarella glacialis, Strain CCMP 1383" /LENGTH=196 /DNA_ID=CAMNT_0002467251 /DNA_START=105 /DNA_END=695 /DNA_ORIENTATION=-